MVGLTSSEEGGHAARRITGAIFDLAPIGIEIYDGQGRLLETNVKCREIFGSSDVAGVKGDNLFEVLELSPESRAALRQGRAVSYEALFDFDVAKATRRCETTRIGRTYLSVLIEPVRDQPDQPDSNYIVLYQDITERKLVDLALRDSEERFRKVFEDGVFGMVIVDRQFRFTRANPAFCSFVGYSEAELQSLTFKDITHPEHLTGDIENVDKVLAGEMPVYKTEKRYVRKDGRTVWGAASISVVRDDRGAFLSFLTMVEDVTQRRHAEEKLAQASERLALATSSGRLGVWDWTIEDNVIVWDDRMLELYGITREQFTNNVDAWANGLHPDDRQRALEECQQALDGVKEWNTEFRTLHPSGKVLHIKAHGVVIRNAQGKPVRMTGINADITQSKRAEQELRLNQARTTAILGGITDTFYSLDPAWRFTTINPAAEKAPFGRPAQEMLGKVIWDLYPKLLGTRIHQHYLDAAQKCGLEHYEAQSPLNQRWYEVFMQGWSGGVDVYMRDTTERKQAEESLRKSEEHLNEALQRLNLSIKSGHLGVWDWNVPKNEMVWDDEMLRMYGHTRESFPGGVEAWQSGLHPEDRERAIADCQAALDGVRPYDTEFRVVRPGGAIRSIKADGLVVRDEQGRPIRMLGLNQDVTEARANQAAVRENEAIFSTFLEHSPVHVFFKDNQGRVLRLSRSFESMLGMPLERTVGKTMDELFPRDLAASMVEDDVRILREGKRVHVVEQLGDRIYETTKFPILVDGKAVMFAGFTVDITERKKAEEERATLQTQLAQAQKMESIGRLAGGVAHDFNNMLGVMLGHLDLADDQLDSSSPIAENLKEIRKAAKRSADLTRQLLAFARKQTIAPKVLDLNETVAGMLKMLQRLVGENIELGWTPGEGVAQVRMDPTQIHQILANLCVNARDAIKDVGHIHITTSRIQVDQSQQDDPVDGVPGDYVMLTVSDDGCGMDRAVIDKLFEPFFTTKELGRGTGLGLSTVHGIVKQNGGHISVESKVGRGSSFRIYLPAHRNLSLATSSALEAIPDLGGRETLLLVEDEELLLQMSRRMLERLGYTVLPAEGPGQAMRLAEQHGSTINLLLTDVVMPEMNGRELANSLRALLPNLKCLFISGYTADFVANQGILEEGISFLQKPFSRHELAATVRRLLDTGKI